MAKVRPVRIPEGTGEEGDDDGAAEGGDAVLEVQVVPAEATPPVHPLPVMEATPAVRIDKWLWAVRIFRTRTAAATACNGGKVTVNGTSVKPARAVRVGDVIAAHNGTLTRTVRVLALLDRRVGAALVPRYLDDQTPPAEYAAARERAAAPPGGYRPPGAGRPTKRERRVLESLFRPEE